MPINFDINKLKQEEASRDASEGPVFSSSPLGSTVREGNLDKYRDRFNFGVPLGESENPIARLDQYMNDTQGSLNKFGSMVGRGLLKIPLGIISAVGGLIELPEVLTKTSDFDNILLQISNKGREGLDEMLPEYSRGLPGSERFDPTSFEWLMANGDSAIESVGFSLLGMALSGGAANVIRGLGASVNAAKIGGALTGAVLMNHSEGIMEASHTYKTLLAKGVPNDVALEAAYKAVNMNRLAMGFEFAQQLSLLRGFKYATSFKDAGKSYATRKLSQYGGMMGSEAMEEIWTGFSNSEAERFGMLKSGKEADTGSSFASRFMDYALSSEGLTEGFMGAIGGAGMTFTRNRIDDISNIRSGNLTREQQYQATSAFINQNPDAIKDVMGEGKGNKFENAKKQFDANTKLFEQMQDAVDAGDTKLYHRLQKQAYAGLAYNNAQQGTLDQFRRTTETLLSMTEEEATEHNINYEELQKNKKEYLDVINTVEKVYDKVENTFIGSDPEVKNKAFNTLYNLEIIPTIIKKNGVDIQNIYSENSQFGATQLNINNTVNQLKALQVLKKQREVVASQLTGEAKIKAEKEIAKLDKKINTVQKTLDKRLDDWNTQFTLEGTAEDNYNSFFGGKKHKAKDFENSAIDEDLIKLHASTENLKLEEEELNEQYNKIKDPKQRELLETEIKEKRAADQKIERDKVVKQAKDNFSNLMSKATTVADMDKAFDEYVKTPEFKSLSKTEQQEIKKQYSQDKAEFIKNNKAKAKPKPNTTTTSTDTDTDVDDTDTDTETENKAKTNQDQPNPSKEEIDRLNKSQADKNFKKKDNILSFAWLNVLYTTDEDGTIVDLFDENEQLIFENIGDPRILDYDRLFNGDELEIFIDTAYATANGIPINEANAYRIPYGIRFKGSQLTAAYIHAFTNPITNSIDPNIEKFIADKNTHASEQKKLEQLRNNLFKQLSSNSNSSVVSAKINNISKGALALSQNWESSSTRLDSDTLFGIVNSNRAIDIINMPKGTEDKYVITYVGSEFPSGALVAMLPSYAKNERKIVLVPSILKTESLTDEDIEIAVHIIQNFDRYSGKKAQDTFGVRGDELLNNILYNGKNTTKFKVDKDKKSGKRLLYITKSGSNWNTSPTDVIDVENTDALITFLKTQRYNVQNKDYIKLEAIKDAEGNITEVTTKNKDTPIPFNEWVLTHTTTNINSFTITDKDGKDTGRKGYFVQPVIGFEFNPTSSPSQSSTTATTTTATDIETKKADIERDVQGNFIPKKYTLNRKGENPAPNISASAIKDESFGGDKPTDIKQVKLLEIRGSNSNGVTVGRVWIELETGETFDSEVLFNDAELAALETTTPQTETPAKPRQRKPQVVDENLLNIDEVLDGDIIGNTNAQPNISISEETQKLLNALAVFENPSIKQNSTVFKNAIASIQGLQESFKEDGFGQKARDFYINHINNVLLPKSKTTFNLNSELASVNPAIAAEVSRIATAENKYQAVGEIVLQTNDEELNSIMFKVFDALNGKEPRIAFHFENNNNLGQYDASIHTVSINKATIAKSKRGLAYVLAHELIHAATVNKLKISSNRAKFQPLFDKAKAELGSNPNYRRAFKNIEEFVAEAFSNEAFKKDLQSIKVDNRNWFTKFIDFIKSLFGYTADTTFLYDLVYKNTEELLASSESEVSEDSFDLYDNFLVPGLTVYQTEEMLKTISYIRIQALRKNKNTTEKDLNLIVKNEINRAYNKILDVDSNDSRLDLFDVVIGVNETEADDFNNDTYKKLTERSINYIKGISEFIREDSRVWDETNDVEANDTDELSDDENTDSDSKERVYDKSPFEDNPKDSASKRLKSYLATQPKVAFTADKENIYVVGNMFNMASLIPFDVLYNTLVDNLANTPTNKIFDKLERLSKYNPQIKKVYNELKQFRESGDLDKVAIYKEFISNFSGQKVKFVTSQFTKFDGNNSYRVIYSNRNNSQSILIDQWHNNFKYNSTNITKVIKGETIVNKEKAEALHKEFKDSITFNKDVNVKEKDKIVKAIELLNRIGISLSSEEVSLMLTTDPGLVEKDYTVKKFLDSADYIIKSLSSKQIITEEGSDLQRLNDNPFIGAESKNLLSLAKVELTVNNNLFSTMFRNEQGKSISAIFKNTVVSKIAQEMFDSTSTIYKNMEQSAFHSNSWIFNQIKKGIVNANNFEIDVFSTINERFKVKGSAKTFKQMTAKERLINKIIMYANEGQNKAYYQFPTQSDKTWVPILGMNRVDVTIVNNKVNTQVLDAFYSIFAQEMYRIIDVKNFYANNERSKMIENYHVTYDKKLKKEVLGFGGQFIFLPNFNSDDITVTIGSGDLAVERAINDLNADELALPEVKAQILDKLNGEVLELIEKERTDLVKNGILHENGVLLVKDKSISKGANKDHFGTNFVANYAVNYALAYNSIYTLFNNDPAFAKDWSDIIKRGAMNSAPGSDLTNEGSFGVAIIKDKKVNSTALAELTKELPSLTDDNTANKIINALTDIEYTDAQAWCSLKHYKSFLSGLGRLTDRVDKIITALQNDKNITQEEMTELLDSVYGSNFVLQPQKPVYVYDTWDPVSKTLVRRYLKYSVFPLFKQLTKDHPQLDALRKKIDASNSKIELVIAKSGVKEGAQFVTEAEDISNDTIINVPWRGLSLQQETPYDKNKIKINTVSQARKLLFGDLLNFNLAFTFNGETYQTKQLKYIYDNLFKASIEEEYEKLSNELNIDENGNITDLKLIRNLLAEEGIRKNYDENFLESLKVENNKFNIPLWISTYSDQIESLLTSIITNRIVKQKMPGRSFVQGSPFGFSKENIISTSSKKAIAALKGMGISNDKVTDEGIYLPNIFDGLEGFKTGDILTEEMLKVVGFRIPNQGHNSMANLKIAGFLPKEVGDLVIVSPDMLVRMGSDFDVDKLYLYIKNAKRVYKEGKYYITPYVYNDKVDQVDVRYKEYLEEAKGKVLSFEAFSELSIERQNSKKARQNAIIDIYMEILSKKELAPRIMRPNDIKELEKVNNRVLELQGKDNNPILNLLSPSAQDEMFESNIAGKSAVGTTSLWSTFLAQVQYYENFGIRIYKQLKDGTKVLANEGIKFKDSEGNLYNDKLVLYKDSSGNVFTEKQAKKLEYKDLVQLENIGLHKVNKVKGVVNDSFISDIIQILQSAAVDNSKEQQMTKGHINDMTLNPAMLMAMSGIDSLPMIISFIAQPYIVSYVKAVQSSKSITATFTSEKAEETEYANLVKAIEKQISKLGGTFKPVDNESSISAFSLKELEDALSDSKNFTSTILNNQEKVVYLQRQYEILHAFKYYMELAQNMNSIVNNMNVDTKSIGKNFIEVSAKNDKIQLDISGNSNFIGVDKLWENTIPGMIHDLAISRSLTIYNDPNLYPKLEFIKYAVDKLKAFKGLKSSDSLSNKDLEGIKRAANHFVTNTLNGLFSNESITQTRNRLINGNDNVKPLHERLLEYQKESVFSNWLLQVLSVDPNTNAISYPSVKIEGNDTVYAIASLVELLNSDDPNVKVFAEDLIKYSFLTSGNNKSKGGLSNIIPIEYLLEKQFGKYYNNDMFIKSLNNPDINNRFLDQYIRNNPTAAFRLDKTIFSNIEGVLKIRESDLIKKAGYMPKYVYVFDKDKKGEITLFGLIGTEDVGKITEVNYQALNILNNEYALGEDLMLSVYEDNNKFNPFLISDTLALSDNKDDTMIVSVEPTEQLDLFSEPISDVTSKVSTVTTTTREYTPEQITSLKPNEVFVFGSNAEGVHGKGSALTAKTKFGAIQGQSEGLQGQSYAVVTKKDWRVEKSSTLNEIGKGLQNMLLFAKATPNKKFLVTKLGSSLAGYSTTEIKGLFEKLKNIIPSNVILPIEYEVRDNNVNVTPTTKKPSLADRALSMKDAGELSNTTPTDPVVKKSSLADRALRRDQISEEPFKDNNDPCAF